jgi:hypothetical protein
VGICFFCLPQAEKAEKARISKCDIFLMDMQAWDARAGNVSTHDM